MIRWTGGRRAAYIIVTMTRLLIGLMIIILGVAAVAGAAGTSEAHAPATLQHYTTPEGLAELINGGRDSYLLVDVRTAAEYAGGHIPTAVNIPYTEIAAGLASRDTDRILVLYCRTGRRSGIALEELQRLGHSDVVDFGGISRWNGELVRQ